MEIQQHFPERQSGMCLNGGLEFQQRIIPLRRFLLATTTTMPSITSNKLEILAL